MFALAAVVPPDLVLCRGGDAHLAVETRWAGCCSPAGSGTHCAPLVPVSQAPAALAGSSCADESCRDVDLGSEVAVSRGGNAAARPAAAAPVFAAADSGGVARTSAARRLPPSLCVQVRDSIRSTVLTL